MIIHKRGLSKIPGFPNGIQVSNELIQSIFSTQMVRIKDSHPIPPLTILAARNNSFNRET